MGARHSLWDDDGQRYYEYRKINQRRRNNILYRWYIWYICKNEVCLIGVWVGKQCDGTAIVGYSINPSESEDGMLATYEGFQACFFAVFKRLRLCGNSKCVLCCNIAEILKGAEMT